MSRRRISIRRVLQFFITIAGITGFVLAMSAAARRHDDRRIIGTDLRITNPRAAHFLDKAALEEMLFTRRHMKPEKVKLNAVDLRRLEKLARTNPWVADAQAFVDAKRVLHVRVTQRVPVVRIFGRDGSSHYLDTALKPLPVSVGYAHYIPVITGVPTMGNDSTARAFRGQMVWLVNRIGRDTFWNAQVSEVAVSADGRGFELVPVLGSHRILLGDTSRLDAKLKGLLSFYKGVLNRVGWDKYTLLDARYRGQVVASPALQWKAPIDRAATNMNWVKTIIGDATLPASGLNDSARRAAPVFTGSAVANPSSSASAPATAPSENPAGAKSAASSGNAATSRAQNSNPSTNTTQAATPARRGGTTSSQMPPANPKRQNAVKAAMGKASGSGRPKVSTRKSTPTPKYTLPQRDN